MELIGLKQSPIKIKRTIFGMSPRIEKTFKVARNLDSGLTQMQKLETLMRTWLRLETIRANAYERWQPYLNEPDADFLGLLGYLSVFRSNENTLTKLRNFFQKRLLAVRQQNPLVLQDLTYKGKELEEDLLSKIYSLQIPASEFRTYAVEQ
jgi:hypothetical protein